jgi:hypothetical protein
MAIRHNLTPYDAAYVVLARRTGAALLTLDKHLMNTPALGVPLLTIRAEPLGSTGRSDTPEPGLDLGRAHVRWSADRAGVHLPLSRPDGAPARDPGQARVLGCRAHHLKPPTFYTSTP